MPRSFLAAVFLGRQASCLSAVVEDESPAVAKRDLFGLPGGALVEAFRLCAGRVPFLIEPIEVRIVIGDPLLDRLPRGLDGLHGVDVERRWWRAGKLYDSFPETLEAEEKFDLFRLAEGADRLHGARAEGTLDGITTPNLEDEIAPEGAHVASPTLGRCGDEKDLGGRWFFDWSLRLGWRDDAVGNGGGLAARFVGVEAVVANGLLAFGREMKKGSGNEVGCFEDLEVALGGVVAFGAVDDGFGGGVPSDFLEGERMAEEILGEAFATSGVVGGDEFFAAVVYVEAGVFPGEEVGEFGGTDEFDVAEGVEEAVAEEFDGGSEIFGGHAVEAAVGGKESVGGKDVKMRVENEVVTKGVEGGDGSDAALREVESGAEGVLEGVDGGMKENGEELAAFAEDAAQDTGDGEDELAVGDFVTDGGGDPVTGGADAALVAGGAEVAALAGEGEEAFVAAIRALEPGEAGGEVTAAEKGLDGADGGGWKRAEGFAVFRFVVCEEVIPAMVDELPEGRGTGTAGLIDGRHKKCSYEQCLCEARSGGMNRILKMLGRAKDWRDRCPLGESGTKILATLKSFALGGKGDGLDGRSGWSNGGAYRPHR